MGIAYLWSSGPAGRRFQGVDWIASKDWGFAVGSPASVNLIPACERIALEFKAGSVNSARFKSFAAKAEAAEKDVPAHKCHPVDFNLNTGRKESNEICCGWSPGGWS
jgi:hypothetical protein